MATKPKSSVQATVPPDLALSIHEGPLEAAPWSSFVDRLRARLNANAASFSFRLDDEIGPGVLAASPFPTEPVFGYITANELDAVGPPPGGATLLPRRLYSVDDFLDRSLPEHREFEREIMLPNKLVFMRVARIPEPSGASAWLSAGRERSDFTAEEELLLASLIPHLEISLKTFITIERERSRSHVANEAVRKLDFCWLRLDQNCNIVDFDQNAQALLQRSGSVHQSPQGELMLSAKEAQSALREAAEALAGKPESRARALHISDEPWLDMLIVPARDQSFVDRMAPGVIAYIHGEVGNEADRHEQLMDLFGLSQKEASLTVALCRGQTIREAAELLDITEGSAREYSKRVYAKTGARGQADLVRMVLTSVVALA